MKITDKIKALFSTFLVVGILMFSTHLTAQGPNAPEAASFEPVDATDMVNLSTGDFTYVLPILNVPSPEGGYPIALAYHAGIAMDQEASWTGLGWNLNSGAINRSVNGYPDDYNNSLLTEYFYDEGEEDTNYNLSLSYSNGGSSIGLGFSWGSNRSLGGYVSIGAGVGLDGVGTIGGSTRIGTDGVGFSGGVTTKGGLSLGVSAHTSGSIGGSIGFDNNGVGFNVSANSNGSYGFSLDVTNNKGNEISLGVSFSSNGAGITAGVTNKTGNKVDGGVGVGIQLQFENTINMGDYSTKSSGWQIPLVVPTPVGVFSLSFGKQKYEYHLAQKKLTYVNGPVHFDEGTTNGAKWGVTCMSNGNGTCGALVTNSYQEALDYAESQGSAYCDCFVYLIGYSSMDIYEVSLKDSDLASDSDLDHNSAAFPSYDKYNVQAQGLSGNMSSRLFENGNLFGLSNRVNNKGYKLRYALDDYSNDILPDHAKFDSKPYFYFDNEISTYLNVTDVSEATFNTNSNNNNILSYYSSGVELDAKPRRKNATFIDYFTNQEISENYQNLKAEGYLLPESGFNINADNLPEKGIGAFKITAIDGKTYHYSLPVYNHEIITRTFGAIEDRPQENQSYFEKRQLKPYATHWLLTAVTGPDYFDTNNNGVADKGDYGYWTTFEYGKWSDAFVWKNPYGEDYFEGEEDDSKTWIRGRKQIYYLDKIKTRTHTALFVKSERQDSKSIAFNYSSVGHADNIEQDSGDYQSRFNIPTQNTLRLDKIILIKESDDTLDKTYGSSSQSSVNIIYNNSIKSPEEAWYNIKDNIIDAGDNWSELINKAIKVINFNYDYNLAKGSPNTTSSTYGRLSLESIDFKGKAGEQLIPSYDFDYINDLSYNFDIEDKDNFGYYRDNNALWSLNKITTPQGGEILIDYEVNKFNTVFKHEILFETLGEFNVSGMTPSTGEFEITSNDNDIGLSVGDVLYDVHYRLRVNHTEFRYDGTATIVQDLGQNTFKVVTDEPVILGSSPFPDYYYIFRAKYKVNNVVEGGGIRVASLTTTDGVNNYRTEYNYGENENGFGYISYLPFAPELQMELPYSSELPAPRVMYEYVSMEPLGANNQSEGKIKYKFKVLKEKDENNIKFGDLYEIDINSQQHTNTSQDKEVVVSSYTIKDNLATLGQLLEVSTYNNKQQLLSKIKNTYYSPDDPTPNSLGITKEAYQTYKIVDYINNTPTKKDKWLVNSSSRVKYPNLIKYSTEYKSGYQYSSQFDDLDEITGQANEVLSIASDGTKIKSKSVPAYYKYAEMDSKVNDIDNKNMLSQITANYSYIKDPLSNTWKETNVGISTWNNNWHYRINDGTESLEVNPKAKIWRKHKQYVWNGNLSEDGTYDNFNDNFNWNSVNQPSEWKEISEITKYTRYSSPIEIKDVNSNRASTKMCDKNSKVLITGNAWYGEMYYSGAEYKEGGIYLDNEILGASYQTNEKAHTGQYSIKLTSNDEFGVVLRSNEHRNGHYKISVWVHKDNYLNARIRLDNSSLIEFNGEILFAGDWVLMNHVFEITNTSINTLVSVKSENGTVYADDFRVYPLSSSVISYVYNKWDELECILNANNLASKFEYDSQGRLIRVYSEVIDTPNVIGGFKKVSENSYNYKNQ